MNQPRLAVIAGALCACFSTEDLVAQPPSATVAVLDFINRQPGDGYGWLAKGLADMVITDLSVSDQLIVVDRERMQLLAREFELADEGILDPTTAPRLGQIAKAQWVLQGTFLVRKGQVGIEALLVDVNTQQPLRIELVEGPLRNVFELETELVRRICDNLHSPMTPDELRRATRLKTQSLSAFEHYSRSLAQFDAGAWYHALQEARLARKADPEYLIAAAQVAQLYDHVNEPEHALIEYRQLVEKDDQNALPDIAYFRMAVFLDEVIANRESAALILQRVLERYREDLPTFDVNIPSRLSHGWDDVGGVTGVRQIAARHEIFLRTLARLAHWQREAGDTFRVAQLRSQMRYFMFMHGMPFGDNALHFGPTKTPAWDRSDAYWQMVRENRDRKLYPGTVAMIQSGQTVDATTRPTHGYHEWQDPGGRFWLAPPNYEIARVSYRVGSANAAPSTQNSQAGSQAADRPSKIRTPVQFDFFSPEGTHAQLFQIVKIEPDGKWHDLKMEKGMRAINTHVFHNHTWQMRFDLRPWSGPVRLPRIGGFQVNVLPEVAEVIHDGKSYGQIEKGIAFLRIPAGQHTVEAHWPNGRRRAEIVQVEPGQRSQICLNADVRTVSRSIVASQGSYPCLLADRAGRYWLAWDEREQGRFITRNQESSIFCSVSSDGQQWSRPRRLAISSLSSDYVPILRQDRQGVYWLIWISERGTRSEKNLWIASSSNGVEWTFPRKVALPPETRRDLAGWREVSAPSLGFAIDARNQHWIAWGGWLLRSDDAVTWHVVAQTQGGANPLTDGNGINYQLSCDPGGRLVLMTNSGGRSYGAKLWCRSRFGDWNLVGHLTDEHVEHPGSAACGYDGGFVAVTSHGSDLYVHEFDREGEPLEPVIVESYLTLPYHPAITPLSDDRWLVAFGSKDGIVAAVFQKESKDALSSNE